MALTIPRYLRSKAEDSPPMMKVPQCCAICFAKHWVATYTSTTVVPMTRLLVLAMMKFSTFTNACSLTLIVPRITLRTACSGKGVVRAIELRTTARVTLFRFQGPLFERGAGDVCAVVSLLPYSVLAHANVPTVMLCVVVSRFVIAETGS